MLRRILVAVISLAIIVACYFLYAAFLAERHVGGPARPAEPIPVPVNEMSTRPAVDV